MFQHNGNMDKPFRGGCTLPMSNEDWQFENPLFSMVDGKVVVDRHKFTRVKGRIPKMVSIHERFKEAEMKTVADFEKLAERINAAKQIAVALTELLGKDADELVNMLYERVKC